MVFVVVVDVVVVVMIVRCCGCRSECIADALSFVRMFATRYQCSSSRRCVSNAPKPSAVVRGETIALLAETVSVEL